ncbi:MAG: hypothetical protein HUU43_08780 [Ignavibacteriaceae bacterium]|nr:hypothetical protein [Ignavibacteriaceae bacterium]
MKRIRLWLTMFLLRKKAKALMTQKRFVSFYNRTCSVIFLMPHKKEMFDAALNEIQKLPVHNKYILIALSENFSGAENVDETILTTKEVFDLLGRPKEQLKSKIAEIKASIVIDLEPAGVPEHAWMSFASEAGDRVAVSDEGCNSLCNVRFRSEKSPENGNIYENFFNFLKMF